MGEHKYGVPERAKKRRYKKIVTTGLIALAIIIVGVIAVHSGITAKDSALDTTSTDTTESSEQGNVPVKIGEIDDAGIEIVFDEPVVQNEFHVGDVMTTDDLKLIFVSSGEYGAENVAGGHKTIRMQFVAENIGTSDVEISFYDFVGYADGEPAVMDYSGDDIISAELSAGRFTTGYIYLNVPVDAEDIRLQYTATDVGESESQVAFIYEGDVDSNYAGKLYAAATVSAYSVGDVAELDTLKVTYLGCEEYISEDDAVQPKDGYRFVSCEFLIERVTESEKVDVSSWDFDCYADGQPYEIKHMRDTDINAILHAGDSVQGTVTFEVPVDADVIEAEFLYDYKNSGRAIFSVELD